MTTSLARFGLLALACLAMAGVECGARIYVAVVEPPQKRALLGQLATDPDPTASPMVAHPFLQYIYQPSTVLGTPFGFHGRFVYAKEPGTVRVACLGGSTTASGWPRRMEAYLDDQDPTTNHEVLNFGVDGWSSTHSLINFVLNVREFEPDYVVVHHAWNDQPSCRECTRGDQADTFIPATGLDRTPSRLVRWGLTHSVIVRMAVLTSVEAWASRVGDSGPIATVRIAGKGDPFATDQTQCREGDPMWVYRRNLRTIADMAAVGHTRTVLTTFPHDPAVNPALSAHVMRCNEVVRELGEDHADGVQVVDLAADFPLTHFTDFAHLDEVGLQIKAERVGRAILDDRAGREAPDTWATQPAKEM